MTPDASVLDHAYEVQWRPPPTPRSRMEFARSMQLPDGPSSGEPWDPATEPMQEVFIREMENPYWQIMAAAWPSQRGKSLTGIGLPLLHTLIELRQNVSYVMPNLEKLDQNWHGKIAPMIDGCGFAPWLPKKGPGSHGGKPSVLVIRDPATTMRAGTLYFMAMGGGGKETSLSAVSTPVVLGDEIDDAENEGQLSLLFRRARSFGENWRAYLMSTVNERKNRDSHPILVIVERGTGTRLWYPCPKCGRFQLLEFERVKFDDIEARYQCEHCPEMWTEGQLKKARTEYRAAHRGQTVDDGGRVVGIPPSGRWYSQIGSDLDFNHASMWGMVREFVNARKSIEERSDHTAMRQYFHKVLCRDYRADIEELEAGTELTWRALLDKSRQAKWGLSIPDTDRTGEGIGHTYSRHIAAPPPEAAFACAGVDIQNNRVYVEASAYSLDGTSYDFAWSYQYARADHTPWNEGELFALLDTIHLWLFRVAGNLPLALIGIDIGDWPAELRKWLATRREGIWKPTMGARDKMKTEANDIDGLVHYRDGTYFLDTDNLRELIHAGYKRVPGSPGSINLPSGLNNTPSDRAYPQHLVAEMQIIDPKTRKPRIRRGPGRWDWQDCRRITHAMAQLHLRKLNKPKHKRQYGVITKLGN